jgi:hypothetical protein
VSSILALAAALFLMAGAAFSQAYSEAHETGDREPQMVPGEPPSPPPEPEPPAPSDPAAGSSEPSEPRTAVPIGPPGDHEGRPQRKPPTRHGGDDGGEVDSGHSETTGSGWSSDADGDRRAPYRSGQVPWRRFGPGSRDDMGALDLDVSPGRTQVYLDGQKIGTADDFDGWPRYLRLPKGRYEIVFYLDGYKTLVRQVTVYPGLVIDVDDRMEPGASIRPEDLLPR